MSRASHIHESRSVAWRGCLNVRDLGGLPTVDGGLTRRGVVFRSDCLSHLSEDGFTDFASSGIRTVIDLRLPSELDMDPNPFATPGAHGVIYVPLSFTDPDAPPRAASGSLAEDYTHMLDAFQPRVGAILREIAHAADGVVVIHCFAGKDRTGLICAMLLDLVGVPREVIGADYALSGERLVAREAEWLEHGPGERADREASLAWGRPFAEVITAALNHLDERYGGTHNYVQTAGLSPDELATLCARLLPRLDRGDTPVW